MIKRDIVPVLKKLASQYPVVTITGPRQSGKTTLAKSLFTDKPYMSLEDPDTRRFALDDPRGFLSQFSHGAFLMKYNARQTWCLIYSLWSTRALSLVSLY